jgi:ribulose-5-phosphate 4-epimerase/fuculose-1-phosphate aldolase
MSMYNLDLICFPCKDAEKKRPDYHQAEAKDLREYADTLRSKGMPVQADTVEEAAELMDYIERVEETQ